MLLPTLPETGPARDVGYSISNPLLTKWVCAGPETITHSRSVVGCSITDPPLTRWVCEKL